MKVRLATIEDLKVVFEMNRSLFKHDSEFDKHLVIDWPAGHEGKEYFSARIIDDDKACFVLESGAEVIGYIAGSLAADSTRNGLVASLDNMFIQKDYRRQGLGSFLFTAFKEWAVTKSVDRISVSAYSGNERALNFYRSTGFQSLAETLEVEI
jgi:ribosomal protein S18 acetylase RimI-like enzyme